VKEVRVQYVAMLREQAGMQEQVITTDAATAAGLYSELATLHGFTYPAASLRVAINDRVSNWSAPLSGGDLVLFLPPSSGG